MAIYKLIDDFDEHSYTLIAIHCSLEDYRIAYFLNSYLNTRFQRLSFNLKSLSDTSFSLYEWNDEVNETQWNLISNISRVDIEDQTGIFKSNTRTNYYIQEHKKVDFFLKIDNGHVFHSAKAVVKKITEIPQVITAYAVDPNQLKSKNNLIFLSNAK